MKHLLVVAVVAGFAARAVAVTIEVVPVDNPGNTAESQGAGLYGRVTKSYQIGKTEITNAQYVQFLNAKAASDPLGLFNSSMQQFEGGIIRSGASGSYTYTVKATLAGGGPNGTDYTFGDKPVSYVSWYDALRFANWMNNGQGTATTEDGAYKLDGGTAIPSNASTITRNANAIWFLPTENEWYKAAYHDKDAGLAAVYFDYPTGADTAPNNNLPSADSGNSANYLIGSLTTTMDPSLPYTSAGAYTLTHSSYGTFDQGGNVAEWNETAFDANKKIRRGGAWSTTASSLSSATREGQAPTTENDATGFRLATIAAPAAVAADYNGNGVVDAADYVVWRDHLGTPFQLTNEVAGTSPGMVTSEDYTAWRARFGNTSGSGASLSVSPVPEPTAPACGVFVALYAAWVRRRVQVTAHLSI